MTDGMVESSAELFLDLENLHYSAVNGVPSMPLPLRELLQHLKSKYFIRRKRAYFDPSSFDFSIYRQVFLDNAIEIITCLETRGMDKRKNSADIKMVIDILDASTHADVSDFIIASGDGDFVPLITKLTAIGKRPIILGFENTTSSILRANSREFISINSIIGQVVSSTDSRLLLGLEPTSAFDPKKLMFEVIRTHNEQLSIGVPLTAIKQAIKRLEPGFDERRHGFDKFSEFVKEFNDIVTVVQQTGTDSLVFWKENAPQASIEEELDERKQKGQDVLKALLGSLNWKIGSRKDRLRVFNELFVVLSLGVSEVLRVKDKLREQLFWDKSGLSASSAHLFDICYRTRIFTNPMTSTDIQEWLGSGDDINKHIEVFVICVSKSLNPSDFDFNAAMEFLEIPTEEHLYYQNQVANHNEYLAGIGIFGVRNRLEKWRIS